MANYLNEFIETIEGVPDEVQRHFCLIRQQDEAFVAQSKDLQKLHADYLADLRRRVEHADDLTQDASHLLEQEKKLEAIRLLHQV